MGGHRRAAWSLGQLGATMKRISVATSLFLFVLLVNQSHAHDPQAKPSVTLTLTRVRGEEIYSTLLEGPKKGQRVRDVLLACDVVIDNQTGDDLTVLSNFFSAFDGLQIELIKDGKVLRTQSYLQHQSPLAAKQRPYLLKVGRNERQLRFPISAAPDEWARLEVKLSGNLPGSKFQQGLTSDVKKIDPVRAPPAN